jgi:hypothetical protein
VTIASASGGHPRADGLKGVQHSGRIDRQGVLPVVSGDGAHAPGSQRPRMRDEGADRTERLLDINYQQIDRAGVTDIEGAHG